MLSKTEKVNWLPSTPVHHSWSGNQVPYCAYMGDCTIAH